MTATTATGTPLTVEQRQWFVQRQIDAARRIERARTRLLEEATDAVNPRQSGRRYPPTGFDLVSVAGEVAAAEELHRLTVLLAGAATRSGMTVETISKVLLDILSAGADDQSSGRTGDLRRTIHDAVIDDIKRVREFLRYGAAS